MTWVMTCVAGSLIAEEPGPAANEDQPAPSDPNAESPAYQAPSNPADFQKYKTYRQQRNESFRKLYSEEADRRFLFILEQIAEQNYDSARRRLQDFLILYPNHPMADRARQELAALYKRDGSTRPALYHYQQSAVLERPKQGEAQSLLEMARIEIRQGRYQTARQLLQDIQNRFSGTEEARQARLLERSYRFVELPANQNPDPDGADFRDQDSPGLDQNRSSEDSDVESGDRSTNREDGDRPLFPISGAETENPMANPSDDTGIDKADGKPSTGQTALDRMGEGIEKLDSVPSGDSN